MTSSDKQHPPTPINAPPGGIEFPRISSKKDFHIQLVDESCQSEPEWEEQRKEKEREAVQEQRQEHSREHSEEHARQTRQTRHGVNRLEAHSPTLRDIYEADVEVSDISSNSSEDEEMTSSKCETEGEGKQKRAPKTRSENMTASSSNYDHLRAVRAKGRSKSVSENVIVEETENELEGKAPDSGVAEERSKERHKQKHKKPEARHMSIDGTRLMPAVSVSGETNLRRQVAEASINREYGRQNSDTSAIDKYYERNQYTITGRNQDTFNRMPLHMRKRNTLQMDAESKRSTTSSPGAVEPATPVKRSYLFKSSLYWLAHNHRKVGFRHLCLTLILLAYTLGGALMFYLIESTHESETVQMNREALESTLHAIALEMTETINNPARTVNLTTMEIYTKNAYIRLISQESLYKGSTFYKLENKDNYKWKYTSAIFFCMNVYTTTGYGVIAADSQLGQWLTMIYGFMFVPLTLVILRDFGQFTLVCTTKIYAYVTGFISKLRKKKLDADDVVKLPLLFCNALMIGYMLACTVFIYLFDAAYGAPGSGITFFHSFYFSFISISTIGLGDIVPNNVTFNPIITLIFFAGMPIMKVVNRVTYVALENGVFGTLTVMENKMDQCRGKRTAHADRAPSVQPDAASVLGALSGEEEATNEMLNNLTIRSIATFMRSDADIYGGGYGRVSLRRGDLFKKENVRRSQSNKSISIRSTRSNGSSGSGNRANEQSEGTGQQSTTAAPLSLSNKKAEDV